MLKTGQLLTTTQHSARTTFNATLHCGNVLQGFENRSKSCNELTQQMLR